LQDLRNDEACEFLLSHPNFTTWYHASDSQHLAILGEMGGGKTIAMAFLVDELNLRNEHQLPRPKVCYYYCRDDETGQAVHIFSALILALLEQLSGLKKTFYEW
jgi:Cdc6-like AAA superfamily ATPase